MMGESGAESPTCEPGCDKMKRAILRCRTADDRSWPHAAIDFLGKHWLPLR
jgi:hypothetical protein